MLAVQQPTSLEAIWRAHGDELMRFATVLVGPADAHDVVVEAVLRAADAIADGRVGQQRSYLFRAVSNRANDLHRSRQRRWARDLHAVVPQITAGLPVADVDIQRAIADLSVTQRAVIYLAYWEDRTERQIAETLGLSHGTVRRHMVRARHNLRRALQ